MKKRNPPIKWSEGEAKTREEINERVNKHLMSSTSFLEALMQESFVQEHVKVIPVSLDVTQQEKLFNNQHFLKEGGRNAHDRYTY